MRWLDDITDSTVMNLGKLRDGEGQGGLARCSPWGRTESDMMVMTMMVIKLVAFKVN